ncbi:olfactory receptor 5AR1-like [Leptodactylus fuscus]|uniref:olfactory receptor 5AR1-like n=1 Tax=Leptodactylus fuscus TaxID=238119 RepID=UPI003F4F0310
MNSRNRTLATEFILLGFSKDLKTNIVLFVVFLLVYLVSIFANCLILCLILLNTNLHIPMYFFLCILSFMDLCVSSSILPRLLVDLVSGQRVISLAACTVQFYIILLMGGTECLLLALMSYDRYVAICRPLHYPVLMRWSNCYRMTALVWVSSFVIFILPSFGTSVTFCNPNQINHFMCEVIAVMKLACEDAHYNEVLTPIACFIALFLPFLFIIISYIRILYSVLKIKSAGRAKAFSTCTSHVTVVVLFFGTAVVMYFGPSSEYSENYGKYLSLFYNVICPTLNPIIYSLNNKDVKAAQRKFFLKLAHKFSDILQQQTQAQQQNALMEAERRQQQAQAQQQEINLRLMKTLTQLCKALVDQKMAGERAGARETRRIQTTTQAAVQSSLQKMTSTDDAEAYLWVFERVQHWVGQEGPTTADELVGLVEWYRVTEELLEMSPRPVTPKMGNAEGQEGVPEILELEVSWDNFGTAQMRGLPKEILIDQGTPFMSKIMKEVCKLLKIKHL